MRGIVVKYYDKTEATSNFKFRLGSSPGSTPMRGAQATFCDARASWHNGKIISHMTDTPTFCVLWVVLALFWRDVHISKIMVDVPTEKVDDTPLGTSSKLRLVLFTWRYGEVWQEQWLLNFHGFTKKMDPPEIVPPRSNYFRVVLKYLDPLWNNWTPMGVQLYFEVFGLLVQILQSSTEVFGLPVS